MFNLANRIIDDNLLLSCGRSMRIRTQCSDLQGTKTMGVKVSRSSVQKSCWVRSWIGAELFETTPFKRTFEQLS